jgi:hypothetical protein
VVLVTLAWPCVAHAEEPEDAPWNHEFSFDVVGGFGTPFGLLGGVVGVTPVPWFTVELGVGGTPSGPQLASMLRIRETKGEVRIGLGLGPSIGPRQATQIIDWADTVENVFTWDLAVRVNAEISLESRWGKAMELRGFFGVGMVANSPSACVNHDAEAGIAANYPCNTGISPSGLFTTVVPYMGLALGHWFGG